ncbi:MAG: ribosome assembly cofactor RimP [Bacteroidia bacterium]
MIDKNYISDLINRKLAGTDCFLVEVKYSPSRIAVFIDKPTGITIGECSDLHRFMYNDLDGKDILETHELEVSSPGMSEPLRVYGQYLRRIGREIQVIDQTGVVHKGILNSADNNDFVLSTTKIIKEGKKKMEQKEIRTFNYDGVKEVKLVF